MYTKFLAIVEKGKKTDYYYRYLENYENKDGVRYMAIKYAKRMDLFKKSELGEILKLIEQPDIISFAGGLPA